ncbi:MAG: biotin/lipoate--protein ligase family protein [Pseudolabrys sp.]
MPLQTRSASGLSPTELTLPPPYTPVRLREFGDAFEEAKARAPREGAGTLVYVGRFDLAEFALVLEPEEPLAQARRAFYAGMAALSDALAATAAPETAINIGWPDAVYINSGLVGGGRLAWPQDAREDQVPDWLVFGAMIRTASMSGDEPGANPQITALAEEGFGESMASQLVESFARNFMTGLDAWQESGFGAVARSYFDYFERERGLRRDIDDNGDLLLRRMAASDVVREALLPRLAAPAWYDAKTKGPWA